MSSNEARSASLLASPSPNEFSDRVQFKARQENAAPYGRSPSPLWENRDIAELPLAPTNSENFPKFVFKHGLSVRPSTSDKRDSLRKMANLEKFLSSVKKTARMSQYDDLPFHSLSTSKRYKGYLQESDALTNETVTFFEREFDVIERIGFGDFAEVFKVRWRRDGRIYALKRSIARFGSCFDNEQPQQAQLRWMDEAFYHSALSDHPNIVECVQTWEESGYFHIQMEFMPKRLDTFVIEKFPLSEQALWMIFTDMLMALDHVHRNGYCHLDIKPENIFIDEFGVTKLGDFSLITIPEAEHKEAGDARYMPLEAMESGNLSFSVDIFSLGITMLEICTDIRLAGHGTEWRSLRMDPLPHAVEDRIPVAMRQILRQMMSIEPRLRPSAAGLLRLYPLNLHVLRRKGFYLGLPLLRMQHAAADFIWTGASCAVKWIKTFNPIGEGPVPVRSVTPPPNMNFAEHALRHHYDASVQKKRSRPQAIPFQVTDPQEVDSIGNLIRSTAEVQPRPPSVSEILSQSFLEAMEDDMEADLEKGQHISAEGSLLSDDETLPEHERLFQAVLEQVTVDDSQMDTEELNHVHQLAFSSDESDSESSL